MGCGCCIFIHACVWSNWHGSYLMLDWLYAFLTLILLLVCATCLKCYRFSTNLCWRNSAGQWMWILTSDSEIYRMEPCYDGWGKTFLFYLFLFYKIFFVSSILAEIDVVSPSNLIMGWVSPSSLTSFILELLTIHMILMWYKRGKWGKVSFIILILLFWLVLVSISG